MKMIECVIRPEKLNGVKQALAKIGILGITAIEVKGSGRQKGKMVDSKGESTIEFLPKVLLKMVVKDQQLPQALEMITSSSRTGSIGDGKIFVSNIEEAIRIRTGQRGDAAL
ncbi:MAG TPA: P-II family nitrogen regulator [Candidatus Latescibacteria bacterium]|nr:P-II family nitrogen regulator [Candidatus Latescibacterota bacterium]